MRRVRFLMAVPPLLVIAACNREPDFDERYHAAGARIEQAGKAIDEQIDAPATSGGEPGEGP